MMAGEIRKLIDTYVTQMSNGNQVIAGTILAKLALQGVISKRYTEYTPDDPVMIEKIRSIAQQANIKL